MELHDTPEASPSNDSSTTRRSAVAQRASIAQQFTSDAQQSVAFGSPRRLSAFQKIRKNAGLLSMMLPGIIVLLVVAYLPMAGIVIAFKDYRPVDGVFGSVWVGLNNFRFLFGTSAAWRITLNTLSMNTLFIVSNTGACLVLALLLNEIRDSSPRMSNIYQAVLFFPYLVSYVLVSYFVFALLNYDTGMVNHMLASINVTPVDWYAKPQYWGLILTLVFLWKSVGFGCIIYLAGMVAINPESYEAARIDGANKWQEIRYITLPLIKPLIILTVLLAIGRIFYADFGLFYQVTRNSALLYSSTDVIDTFVYRSLITLNDVGMSSAAGVFQSIVGFVLIVTANWFVRRIDPDQAAF